MARNFITVLVVLCLSLAQIHAFAPSSVFGGLSTTGSTPQVASEPGWISAGASRSPTAIFGKKAARAQGNESKRKKERPKKQKDDVIEVEAVVLESLPNAMFRCAIDNAPETQPPILATISGKIRKNFVKILVGDKVLIELSPYDLTRGRITFRYR